MANLGMPLDKVALLKRVACNLGNTLSQDVGTLKAGAAFWATWIQIFLRCGVSIKSSVTAPPEDAYFVRRQSAQVLFRELVGGTLGFGVVAKITGALKNKVAEYSGYQLKKPGTTNFGQALDQAKAVLKGTLTHIDEAPLAQTGQAIWQKTGELKPTLLKVGAFLQKHGAIAKDLIEPTALEKAAFQWAHTWVPVGLGSVPAVLLAGWWLERTTLFHGDKVVDFITGDKSKFHPHLRKKPQEVTGFQPEAVSSSVASSTPPMPSLQDTPSLPTLSVVSPAALPMLTPNYMSAASQTSTLFTPIPLLPPLLQRSPSASVLQSVASPKPLLHQPTGSKFQSLSPVAMPIPLANKASGFKV